MAKVNSFFEESLVNNELTDDDFFLRPIPKIHPLKEIGLAVKISSPLGKDKLLFESFQGTEIISNPFEFKVRAYSEDVDIDFKKLIGKNVSVTFETSKDKRVFSGIVSKAISLINFETDSSKKKKIAFYGLILRPQFWCSNFSKKTRIFFKKKPKEIIESILKEDGVSFTNKATSLGNTVNEYCVQYNESNFDFVSRLMEKEGIFYFFEYTSSGAKMILAGKNKDAASLSGKFSMKVIRTDKLNSLNNFFYQSQITTKKYSAIDYDYMKPATALKASGSGAGTVGEVYEYPGNYDDSSKASKVGPIRIKELNWCQNIGYGDGTFFSFTAGGVFKLEDHARKALNQKYLIYSVTHNIITKEKKLEYLNSFVTVPESVDFIPIRKTKLPYIQSNQTAIVVGPKDKEISCDAEGRVLVQFYWDLEGKKDGKNSCPVRCMQGWAGEGFGIAAIPRIGMEVVVSFINGNPDRPLIIGCVYNGKNKMPPDIAKKPQILMLKTKTTPKGGKKGNIMSFDDTKDKEKITFNATKDFELSSIAEKNIFMTKQDGKNTKTQMEIKEGLLETKIKKGEKKTNIDEGNFSISLKKGSMTLMMENGDEVTTIKKGNYIMKIEKGEVTINVKKGLTIKSEDFVKIEAKKDIDIKSNANISLTAKKDISLKATGNINLKATKNIASKATSDFTIDGKAIKGKAKMDVSFEGLNIKEKAKMNCAREGLNIKDKAKMNCNREGLMIKDEGKVQATFAAKVKAGIDGKVQAQVKGGAMAKIGGAITMIG